MAEWSKAPDSRLTLPANGSGCSGPRMRAWVRIPLLTLNILHNYDHITIRFHPHFFKLRLSKPFLFFCLISIFFIFCQVSRMSLRKLEIPTTGCVCTTEVYSFHWTFAKHWAESRLIESVNHVYLCLCYNAVSVCFKKFFYRFP